MTVPLVCLLFAKLRPDARPLRLSGTISPVYLCVVSILHLLPKASTADTRPQTILSWFFCCETVVLLKLVTFLYLQKPLVVLGCGDSPFPDVMFISFS